MHEKVEQYRAEGNHRAMYSKLSELRK